MAGKRLLIVAHAPSDNTRRLAEAALRGATHPDLTEVEAHWIAPLEAGPNDVLAADAIILGTTENLGYMSGALKVFLDRSFYAVVDRIDGKPYALFVRAGNDGTGAITSVQRILSGLNVREVQPPLLIAGEFDEARLEECRELGLTMAAGLEAGVF